MGGKNYTVSCSCCESISALLLHTLTPEILSKIQPLSRFRAEEPEFPQDGESPHATAYAAGQASEARTFSLTRQR